MVQIACLDLIDVLLSEPAKVRISMRSLSMKTTKLEEEGVEVEEN